MVTRDLRSRCGALLVAAGTRLSATSAQGVGRLLGHPLRAPPATAGNQPARRPGLSSSQPDPDWTRYQLPTQR